jgi:ATP-dependent Clp protease ATP-binding subunit ClpC
MPRKHQREQETRKTERQGARLLPDLKDGSTSEKKALIERRVFGQPKAAENVAKALTRFEGGMQEPGLPIGTFLFLGPTGVGKTEMAKAIAEMWFGSDQEGPNFLKLNMSEYGEAHSKLRLVGAPPSYVGYNESPAIPHAWANTQNRKVLLLDEWEKAHPEVRNIFLSAFEEGFYEARNGQQGFQRVYFGQTLVVLTSNAGSKEINEAQNHRPIGFGAGRTAAGRTYEEIEKIALRALPRYFTPESLRRVNPIVFGELTEPLFDQILNKFLGLINARNAANNAPAISLSREARAYLVAKAFKNKDMGGSAIRTLFANEVVAVVSEYFVAGHVTGEDTVRFEFKNGKFEYHALPNTQKRKALTVADLDQNMLATFDHLSGRNDGKKLNVTGGRNRGLEDLLAASGQPKRPLLPAHVPPFKKGNR